MTNRQRRLLTWWAAATCLWFGFWLLALSVDPAFTRCFPRADLSDTAWCHTQWHDWPTPLAQLAGTPVVVLLIGLAGAWALRGFRNSD
jgi:hypothetical protein